VTIETATRVALAGYELDSTVDRFDGGRVLAGGFPSRLVRLSEAGAEALDAALGGRLTSEAGRRLVMRLERDGLLHPVPARSESPEEELTTIIPVRDGGEELLGLVRELLPGGEVVVVDDRATDGAPGRAEALGARVVPNRNAPGPAGARNAGLKAVDTKLVAFVDADCIAASDWHRGLGALFRADPTLALVAPRIRAAPGGDRLARYESRCSPLDLGAEPSLVGAGRRVAYLPSTAFVADREVLLAAGGFDECLRFGEDVDLVLRLLASGRSARYMPRREVFHRSRAKLGAMASQRAGYGGSAPELARLHGGAIAPLRVDRHGLAVLVAGVAAGPIGAALALGVSVASTAAQGSDARTRFALGRISLRGHVAAARHLSRALAREWLPLTLGAAVLGRRSRKVAATALLLDVFVASRAGEGRAQNPATFAALRFLDNAAYSCGVWKGTARRRSLRAVAPTLERRGR
jgi:mycofactocin system glycosyltransferase